MHIYRSAAYAADILHLVLLHVTFIATVASFVGHQSFSDRSGGSGLKINCLYLDKEISNACMLCSEISLSISILTFVVLVF